MDKILEYFSNLHVNKKNGLLAPHKPILLLTIINFIEAGAIESSKIYLTSELENSFRTNWNRYIGNEDIFKCQINFPFFHMNSEPFWTLKKSMIYIEKSEYTLAELKDNFICAEIDEELFEMLKVKSNCALLRVYLIGKYLMETHGLTSSIECTSSNLNHSSKKENPISTSETLIIKEYNAKSFIVCGNTKPAKDMLKELGGFYNKWIDGGMPAWIFSQKKYISVIESLNSNNIEFDDLTSLKEQKCLIFDEYETPSKHETSQRAKKTSLKVTFLDDGVEIFEAKAKDTFAQAIKRFGCEKVVGLNIKLDGVNIVSKERMIKYGESQVEMDGWLIGTHSNTKVKKEILEKIASRLKVRVQVEIV